MDSIDRFMKRIGEVDYDREINDILDYADVRRARGELCRCGMFDGR